MVVIAPKEILCFDCWDPIIDQYCESNDKEGDNADVVELSLTVGKRNPNLCKLVTITAEARNTNQPVWRNTDVCP